MTQTTHQKPGRRLTGWHVLGVFVAFFGVVFAVNGVMTYVALSTFSGIETPNAYQTGRDYNETIEAAAAQRALGWQVDFDDVVMPTAEGTNLSTTVTIVGEGGAAQAGLAGTVTFWRPVARGTDVTTQLREVKPGVYVAQAELPARGHWEMRLSVEAGLAQPYYLERRVWAGGAE